MQIRDPSYSWCNTIDYTDSLPDECLALTFSLLTASNDRNNSSLVSHRWLRLEAQTRTHLTLHAQATLTKPYIPSIFTWFNSLTQLVLLNNYYNPSINDNDIILITSMCSNLTTLKLHECKQLTDSGIAVFSNNCQKLKNFLCYRCGFSDIGMAALLDNSSQLEVLSVDSLCYLPDVEAQPNFHAAKNLKRLELRNCGRNWDRWFAMIPDNNCFADVHLYNINVTDAGVPSLSKCRDLIALHIENVKCTNVGLISVAQNCKGLKKIYVRYTSRRCGDLIGDEGLIAVGKHSVNLEELTLCNVGGSCVSLQVIATNCRKLIRLEVYWFEKITEAEMISIVEKCVALRILCIDREVYALARLDSMRARERLDNC